MTRSPRFAAMADQHADELTDTAYARFRELMRAVGASGSAVSDAWAPRR
jgi:hypothetical protein